jgi:transcriptional antiterminator NusG
MEKNWYVIRCSSGQEKKAKKHIESEFNNQNLNQYVERMIIPTRKEIYIKNGKKVNRDVNYYPGYILIEGDLTPEVQHVIKETAGVISILGSRDKSGKEHPDPIRPDEIRKILSKVDSLFEEGEHTNLNFIIGENIIVSEGPFANFNGTIEEINEEKKKLKVSIKIFGRKTPLEIDFSQVVKN